MDLQKRNCCIDMKVGTGMQGQQSLYLTIGDDRYEIHGGPVLVIGDNFGNWLDLVYELYIESCDDCQHERRVKCIQGIKDGRSAIIGLTGEIDWEDRKDSIVWKFERELYTEDIMVQIEANCNFGKRIKKYTVPYFDLCYATAKAATAILKKTGIIGYHFLGETDKINIHHLLYVKYLGIFQKPPVYPSTLGYDYERYPDKDKVLTLNDEIRLLQFEM